MYYVCEVFFDPQSKAEKCTISASQSDTVVVICTFSKMRLEYQHFLP